MLRTCLSVGLLVLLPSRALAETIHVPQDLETIQLAVDSASDGDTILVHAGTYEEAVTITDKTNLVLRAVGKVFVDPPGDVDAITMTGCDTCTVEKFRIIGADNGVRLVDCFTCSVLKCRIEDVLGTGVLLEDCNNCKVEKCLIFSPGEDGIGLGSGGTLPCQLANVRKNKIFEPGDDGVDLNGTNSIIDRNLVFDAVGNGYRSESVPPATTNTFLVCKSFRAQADGFEINGTSNNIFFCTNVDSTVNGIECNGTGTYQLLACKSIKPGGNGVVIEAGIDDADVQRCKAIKPGADGFKIEGDNAFLFKNKVSLAGNDGFGVGGDLGFYEKNSAKGCTSDGFQLLGTGNELTKNKAKGSVNGFDLNEQTAGNTIADDNKFGTTGP